jgi:pantetheine-phosphate adenylyltransferase
VTTKVLYPGSFDPLHNGHLEIVEIAHELFDLVAVAVVYNPQKPDGMFRLAERVEMARESLAHLERVEVLASSSLVVDLVREVGARFVVKGLRTATDFEVEMQMAQMNHAVGGTHTVFLPTAGPHAFVASRWIREIAAYGGDVAHLVPAPVAKRLEELHGRR